jgi:hypothetical protein
LEPIKRGQLEHNIESANVVFLDTGDSIRLETKPDSVCHFFEPFQVGNDAITLRLDWSDLDENGNPTLDADFVDSKTNKKQSLKGERRDAHHTSSLGDRGRSYSWEFKNYKRPFKVLVCWLVSASLNVKFDCSASAEVIRLTDRTSK